MKNRYSKFIYLCFVFLFAVCCANMVDCIIKDAQLYAASWTSQTEQPKNVDKDGYTLIENEKQMAYLINNISASGKYKLTRNLNMGANTWPGIQKVFSGTFDGAGFVIENISTSTSTATMGFFTQTSGATIKNISFANCKTVGLVNVGTLVGYSYGATTIKNIILTNCKVEVPNSTSSYWPSVGGVIGQAAGTTNIQNAYNFNSNGGGYVKSTSGSTSINDIYMGGIIGLTQADVTVKYCYNEVPVSNNNVIATANGLYTGGIVGWSYSAVSYCGNSGAITAGNSSVNNAFAGGIVGRAKKTVSYCYNYGTISSTARKTTSQGNRTSSSSLYSKKIHDSGFPFYIDYNAKFVRNDSSKSCYYKYTYQYAYAGGITGYSDTTVSYCYNQASVSGGSTIYYDSGSVKSSFMDSSTTGFYSTQFTYQKYVSSINGNVETKTTSCYASSKTSISRSLYTSFVLSGGSSLNVTGYYTGLVAEYGFTGGGTIMQSIFGANDGYMYHYAYFSGSTNSSTGAYTAKAYTKLVTDGRCISEETNTYNIVNVTTPAFYQNYTQSTVTSSNLSSTLGTTYWKCSSSVNGGKPYLIGLYWE